MDLVEAAPPPLLPPGKPNDPELKRPESPAPVLAPRPNEEKSVIGGVTKLITYNLCLTYTDMEFT